VFVLPAGHMIRPRLGTSPPRSQSPGERGVIGPMCRETVRISPQTAQDFDADASGWVGDRVGGAGRVSRSAALRRVGARGSWRDRAGRIPTMSRPGGQIAGGGGGGGGGVGWCGGFPGRLPRHRAAGAWGRGQARRPPHGPPPTTLRPTTCSPHPSEPRRAGRGARRRPPPFGVGGVCVPVDENERFGLPGADGLTCPRRRAEGVAQQTAAEESNDPANITQKRRASPTRNGANNH